MRGYYTKILQGKEPDTIYYDYIVDVAPWLCGKRIEIKSSTNEAEDSSITYLSEFENEIKKSRVGIFWINYNDGTLIIKVEKNGYYEVHRCHLTKKALADKEIVSHFRKIEKNYNFELQNLGERFARDWANVLYNQGEILINDANELVEFKHFLRSTDYITRSSIKSKFMSTSKKQFITISTLACCAVGVPLSFVITPIGGVICGFVSWLVTYNRTEHIFESLINKRFDQFVENVIKECEQKISLPQGEQIKCLEERQDTFIDDIRKCINKINENKYDGYKEHLRVLYRLAEYYLKIKKANSDKSPYELFLSNDSLMNTLITIERSVEQAIYENNQKKTSDDILEELRTMTGLSEEELILEESSDLGSTCIQDSFESAFVDKPQPIENSGATKLLFKKKKNSDNQ